MNFASVYAILGIAFLVFFHELGHWLAARSLGLKTLVFSVGFGSKATSISLGKFWETEFRLGLIPLGGFVVIPELQDEASGRAVLLEHGLDEACFVAQPVWKRAIVAASGPLANVILAYCFYVVLLIQHRHLMPLDAISAAVGTTFSAASSVVAGMLMMLHLVAADPALPAGALDIHGVLGIFQVVQHSANSSIITFGQLLAYLSLNLAVINLVPLPSLDGGTLLFLAIEKMLGRPLSVELRTNLTLVAVLCLILITGVGLVNDLTKPVSF